MQTPAGRIKMMETIRKKYGLTADGKSALHVRIGAKGGVNGKDGGFASNKKDARGMTGKERATHFGAIGGRISRRRKAA
jgi:hypothetical protein